MGSTPSLPSETAIHRAARLPDLAGAFSFGEVNETLHSELRNEGVRIKKGPLLELSPLSLALGAPALRGLLLEVVSREYPLCFFGSFWSPG